MGVYNEKNFGKSNKPQSTIENLIVSLVLIFITYIRFAPPRPLFFAFPVAFFQKM